MLRDIKGLGFRVSDLMVRISFLLLLRGLGFPDVVFRIRGFRVEDLGLTMPAWPTPGLPWPPLACLISCLCPRRLQDTVPSLPTPTLNPKP